MTSVNSRTGLGHVTFLGAGPGDAGLLTLAGAAALQAADIILHDRLVSDSVLDLAGASATRIAVGKEGFGAAVAQADINDLITGFAREGRAVLRLKAGDATIFARLDEEIAAVTAAGLTFTIIPGITAASAAAAAIGASLTRRGRNSRLHVLTGHDARGYAEQDWRALSAPGAVAAIYMGHRSARFLQGRLMMHGAAPDTPVTLVENASRPDQRILTATLATMSEAAEALSHGPVITLFGVAPRRAGRVLTQLKEAQS